MTALSAIKPAILRCTGAQVSEVYSSTDQICIEMVDLANEVATDIAKGHDWRALTKIHTIAGATTVPLPADYDRMTVSSEVDDPATWFWGYEPIQSVNEWMRLLSGAFATVSPGGWIIMGGEMHFYPGTSGQASYPYISTQWARDEKALPSGAFTADNDKFVLDERLLTLGLIWRWKEQKGLEYAEDMATYEAALAQAQSRDKGSYVLRSGRAGGLRGTLAYSGRAIR